MNTIYVRPNMHASSENSHHGTGANFSIGTGTRVYVFWV